MPPSVADPSEYIVYVYADGSFVDTSAKPPKPQANVSSGFTARIALTTSAAARREFSTKSGSTTGTNRAYYVAGVSPCKGGSTP
jgi:hypothetical protein